MEFANGDDRFRYNYRSEEVKKVIIETRPHSKRNSSDDKKHYSQSSGISEFGSVMNYISSPESAYSTGYSTLHSDDCLSPPKALDTDAPKAEYHMKSHNGMAYTPTIHMDVPVPLTNNNNNPSNISYVDCKFNPLLICISLSCHPTNLLFSSSTSPFQLPLRANVLVYEPILGIKRKRQPTETHCR